MTTSPTLRVGRFLAVAFIVTVVAAGLTILWFSFPDTRPPTLFESICGYVCLVVSWPLFAMSVFAHNGSDPQLFVFILLWISSGLFWAFVVELFFRIRRRYVA
jgi:hypothetical protein